MSYLVQLISKIFPLEFGLVIPVCTQTTSESVEGPAGILWAYAPKQKSLSGRTKRRELRYVIPLKTGITGCPSCGHPIMFPRLCGNCLRYVISREWEYRKEHYTMERLEKLMERWEMMKSDWKSSPYLKPSSQRTSSDEIL